MRMRVWSFLVGGILSFGLGSVGTVAVANPSSVAPEVKQNNGQTFTLPIIYEDVQDLFQQAITYESGTFFSNRSLAAQLQFLFGVKSFSRSSFPENELTRDTNLLHTLYEDYLDQQAGDDPIRTRDLENPYSSSLNSPDFPQ